MVDDKASPFGPWCLSRAVSASHSRPCVHFSVVRPVGVRAELICQRAAHSVKDACR